MDRQSSYTVARDFQILFLDFSRVGGLDRTLAENFDDYCCGGLDDFASIYEPYYYPGFEEEMKAQYGTTNKLNFLDRKARNNGSKLYLIVDEYDNFTNVVLNEQGDKVYHALTHASGFYREIFQEVQRHVRTHLHDRSQPRNAGRPD